MKNIEFKKLVPYLSAIVIFIVLTLIFFSPIFEGKQLKQGDIINYLGSSQEIAKHRDTYHEEPLWTNSMFGGMPATQISVVYKNNLVSYIDRMFQLYLPAPANLVFLYLIGFFILLIVLGVNPWLSIIGAVAFGFSSYFFIIIEAGHNTKAHAIAYMAPVLAGFILTLRKKYLLGGILFALFLSLELYCNHLQITYYLLLIILVWGIVEFIYRIKEKEIASFMKAVAVLIVAGILAIMPNITNMWSTLEYTSSTTRGKSELTDDKSNKTTGLDKDYAMDWSYGIAESFSLLVPNIKGGATESLGNSREALKNVPDEYKEMVGQQNHYWGDQPFTSGPVYSGALIIFLFVLGLFLVQGRIKWILLIVTVLSMLLAWGKNFMGFNEWFFDHFPLYNKFRAVSMILVIAEFTIPLLGIIMLKRIFEMPIIIKENKKLFYVSFGLTGGLLLLFWIMPSAFFNFFSGAELKQFDEYRSQNPEQVQQIDSFVANLQIARLNVFTSDVIRSFFIILIGAASILLYSMGKIKKEVMVVIIGIVILFDMFSVNKRYLNDKSFVPKYEMTNHFTPSSADEQILKDPDPNFRVLNLAVNTFNDASTSYFHKSIGGYHGAKLKRYQELIEKQISKNNMNVLNMLNTKYFIQSDSTRQLLVQQNPFRLGNVWFVDSFRIVPNADAEIAALSNFNPAKTAIIDKRFAGELKELNNTNNDSLSSIKLTNYKANELTYDASLNSEKIAVFSEIYYDKGWNAYIDGKQTDYFRANYVLRAMVVPKGNHKIVFKFEPKSFYTGEKISLAGSLILILSLIGILFLEIKPFILKKK